MIPLTLREIAAAVGGTVDGDPEVVVDGPAFVDSRSPVPGGLFVAVVGEHVDGHEYAAGAHEAGAAAVLGTRPTGVPAVLVGDPVAALGLLARHVLDALDVTVLALTGSQGKTGTKDYLAQVLGTAGPMVATAHNFNNELGVPLTVLRADATTAYLVVEMGARGVGHISYLCRIAPPRVGAVLNVGTAHLGEFGSREAIAATKAELPQAVPASGVVILNADDPVVAAMAEKTAARVVRVGRSPGSDVWADDVVLDDLARAHFTMHVADAQTDVTLAVHGDHQVSNALSAAAVALECGADLEQVAGALAAAGPVSRHRMQVVTRGDGVTVINDAYNANPDSMRAGLKALAWMSKEGRTTGADQRRSWAVLGEMAELGDEAIAEHDSIGRLAVRLDVSRLVVVGTGRSMSAMHHGAVMEGSWGSESTVVADAEAALELLRGELREGDVVLVKASKVAGLAALALLRAELAEGDVVLVKASKAAGLAMLADALVGDPAGDGAAG